MEWTNEKYLDFIDDYRKREVLWDVRNDNYKNIKYKRDVLLDFAQKYDLEEDVVKRKIKNLRSAFHREHHRLINKKCSGLKKWFAYESLQFILEVSEYKKEKVGAINYTNPDENIDADMQSHTMSPSTTRNIEDNILSPTSPSTSMSQDCRFDNQIRRKRKKSLNMLHQTEHKRRAKEAFKIKNGAKRDDINIYGEYVSSELRKLSHISQTYVKHLIGNILFKAALGVYDKQQVTHGASMSTWETSTRPGTPDIPFEVMLDCKKESPSQCCKTQESSSPNFGD